MRASLLASATTATSEWARAKGPAAKRLVLAELDALGISTSSLAGQPLHLVVEAAAAVERTHENAAKTRRDLDAAHHKATAALTRKQKDLEEAQAEWKAWTAEWEAALKVLQFPATATPETAEACACRRCGVPETGPASLGSHFRKSFARRRQVSSSPSAW